MPREGGASSTPRLHDSIQASLEYRVTRPSAQLRTRRVTTAFYVASSQPYAAFAFASWIARHTRSGVSGMSIWVMPYSDSASTTALTMQTRLPAQPASPQPLVPSGLDFAGEGWSPTSI